MRRSIRSISNNATLLQDLTPHLRNIPPSTGSGPFISYPHIKPLNPLLNISLPYRSILNLRNETNILSINGSLTDIQAVKKVIKIGECPLVFNQIYTDSNEINNEKVGLSLILSNGNNNNFVNIDLQGQQQKQKWVVMKKDSLIGWYGEDLQLDSTIINESNGIQISTGPLTTKANIILSNQSQLFTINLNKDEVINLHTPSIVAYTMITQEGKENGVNVIQYPRFPKFDVTMNQLHFFFLKIGYFFQKFVNLITSKQIVNKEDEQFKFENSNTTNSGSIFPQSIRQWILWTRLRVYKFFYPTYLEFKGPATVIITNNKK